MTSTEYLGNRQASALRSLLLLCTSTHPVRLVPVRTHAHAHTHTPVSCACFAKSKSVPRRPTGLIDAHSAFPFGLVNSSRSVGGKTLNRGQRGATRSGHVRRLSSLSSTLLRTPYSVRSTPIERLTIMSLALQGRQRQATMSSRAGCMRHRNEIAERDHRKSHIVRGTYVTTRLDGMLRIIKE